jgi:putative membrane protein insertion efficiency factor
MSRAPLSTRVLVGAIALYQGVRAGKPSPCRFIPSCSQYAEEAIHEHGAWRGSWFAMRRIARCNPFGKRGFDPVPS